MSGCTCIVKSTDVVTIQLSRVATSLRHLVTGAVVDSGLLANGTCGWGQELTVTMLCGAVASTVASLAHFYGVDHAEATLKALDMVDPIRVYLLPLIDGVYGPPTGNPHYPDCSLIERTVSPEAN